MPTNGGLLSLLNKFTKGVILLVILAVVVTLFIPLFRESQGLRERKYDLEQQIKLLEAENKRLQEEATALSRDPKAVERVAREKMGWAKPNEKVYRFEPVKPNAASNDSSR